MKKVLLFIGLLIPWGASALIPIPDTMDFYASLEKPFFAPPGIVFPIVWTILFILIASSLYLIFSQYKFNEIPTSYKLSLLINYIFNQSYTLVFFGLKNAFLGFISTIGTFISGLFLYYETKKMNKKASKLLIPYLIWSLFASVLALVIYLLNG